MNRFLLFLMKLYFLIHRQCEYKSVLPAMMMLMMMIMIMLNTNWHILLLIVMSSSKLHSFFFTLVYILYYVVSCRMSTGDVPFSLCWCGGNMTRVYMLMIAKRARRRGRPYTKLLDVRAVEFHLIGAAAQITKVARCNMSLKYIFFSFVCFSVFLYIFLFSQKPCAWLLYRYTYIA